MMKKYGILLMLMMLLTACSAEETFETISDEVWLPAMAQPGNITVQLPGETALPVIENDHGRIYICNDYEIVIQTLEAGDLEKTMQAVAGRSGSELTVMETSADGVNHYEFVWAAAGETGDQVGRGAILDDGNYHYCLSVLRKADAGGKSQVNWDQVFSSFALS